MSVLLETTHGNIVVDLHYQELPIVSFNFIKLCLIKYFKFCKFHSLEKDIKVEFSDKLYPISKKGESIWDLVDSTKNLIKNPLKERNSITNIVNTTPRGFIPDDVKMDKKIGSVSILVENKRATSKIRIHLSDHEQILDDQYKDAVVFGQVSEGFNTLNNINKNDMSSKDIIIRDVYVLEDPYIFDRKGINNSVFLKSIAKFGSINRMVSNYRNDDLEGTSESVYPEDLIPYLKIPNDLSKLEDGERYIKLMKHIEEDQYDLEKMKKQEMDSQALTLELLGDLPSRNSKPLENILFVYKLNPITNDEDLKLIFNKFGDVIDVNIIKDKDTGTSLCYGFVEFKNTEICESAYIKITKNDLIIDGRKVLIDFSQSIRNKRKRNVLNC